MGLQTLVLTSKDWVLPSQEPQHVQLPPHQQVEGLRASEVGHGTTQLSCFLPDMQLHGVSQTTMRNAMLPNNRNQYQSPQIGASQRKSQLWSSQRKSLRHNTRSSSVTLSSNLPGLVNDNESVVAKHSQIPAGAVRWVMMVKWTDSLVLKATEARSIRW